MTKKIRIVLCDDHPIFLAGLRMLIEGEEDLELVGQANDGLQAVQVIGDTTPDIAVIDISMPKLNGIALARRLVAEHSSLGVLILTFHEDRVFMKQAMESGARGYLLKRSAAENLLQAIRAIFTGGVYIDPAVAQELLHSPRDIRTAVAAKNSTVVTGRESTVLRLAAKGFTNKEIARQLELSIKSVETYKFRGLEKLGLKSRAELVRYATTEGWFAEV